MANMLAVIHIAKQEMGLADEDYREILRNNFKRDSSKDLNAFQQNELLRIFKKLGWKPKKDKTRASVPQVRNIKGLEKKLGWDDNSERLQGFIKRQIGHEKKVEWLTPPEASKVIEGLKKMERRMGNGD